MKLLAIIICYNPDFALLIKNIAAFYTKVDKLLIWDNSSNSTMEMFVRNTLSDAKNIECVGDGINHGISYPLNFAWEYAKKHGYDALMTMDQDSVWQNFDDFFKVVQGDTEYELKLWGPETNQQISHVFHKEEKDFLITSGMIIPVKILDTIGGYPKNFFIDGIDIDICAKAKRKGFGIYCVKGCVLKQQFGSNLTFTFWGKTYPASNYNPQRLYGIFRNHIIIYRSTHSLAVLKLIKGYSVAFIRAILLFENNKINKLQAIARGVKDGILYKI